MAFSISNEVMHFWGGGMGSGEMGLHPNDAVMRLEFDSWHLLSKGQLDGVRRRRQLKSGRQRNRKLAQD